MFFILAIVLLVVAVASSASGGAALTRADIGYIDGKPFALTLTGIGDGHWLRSDAAAAFERMRAAASAVGVALKVNSSFRTNAKQAALYAGWVARLPGFNRAAEPGKSNHQSGTAVDIDSLDDDGQPNAESVWLTANAASFGFHRTVPDELWHFDFIAAA